MRTPLHVRAAGFGLDAFHVDGNDVMAVHAITALATERIRDGGGPALIEAQTYRFGGHSSSDDPKRYRSEDDVAAWQLRDPLARSEAFLRASGIDEAYFAGLVEEADDFAASVRTACRSIAGAALESVFDAVYAEPHAGLAAERAAHLAHVASYGSET